ncbi:hypothetical protein A2160_02785 [Candidatus Beckwithbacteria bacterium RBG_13_42_9]|uniref:Amine oxidase domain-containing protein n=1 Tax=Candidatus Beckwithbacteria bacterium RBG_13_42_9 TaxID=1797457 RepID=A0A1F5E804_9BACT|nr:MAG: hypothetical protein A2160_02785 [Candidatus Beckwithbacteria bacterium RBG_13_42_9]
MENKIVIIGAGPAGLTVGYELKKRNQRFYILEKDSFIGGIARTIKYKGFRFDIGGHRFFTKDPKIERIWKTLLPPENWLKRQRLSRIYYDRFFFDYPLRLGNVVRGLGVKRSAAITLSYLNSRLFPIKDERTFEDWIVNRFGRHLYRTFFKTYTEKLWGVDCNQIQAQWAAQRIRGLSFFSAVKDAICSQLRMNHSSVIKTLITEFSYPKLGPGMLWEAMMKKIEDGKIGRVNLNTQVVKLILNKKGNKITKVVIKDKQGMEKIVRTSAVFSSMPISQLIPSLYPSAPHGVIEASQKLHYRDFILVALMFKIKNNFPDNWIYIHAPEVKIGRVQNFKNWSPFLVPNNQFVSLGLEYFCTRGDLLWNQADSQLKKLAKKELIMTGLLEPGKKNIDGKVVRVPKAYPVYDQDYKIVMPIVRHYLQQIKNLYPIGRNGMHKYNNMDHSMLTAILSVKNFYGAKHDIWRVNTEKKYHEEKHEY